MAKAPTTITDLTLDPKNARKRGPRAEGLLVASLHEVGAARSIVIDEDGRILAGNGTVQAAAEAGIEKVKVVDADGETIIAVRRTGLTEQQKRRLALLDNRTGELAEWDPEMLAALAQDGTELNDLWAQDELDALMAGNELQIEGFTPDADVARTNNNLQMANAGARVGLQCGDIMVTIARTLYEQVAEYVLAPIHDDRSAAMSHVLQDGVLSCSR